VSVDLSELLALYEGERATAAYDEVVTEREHALQAAALAEAAGADEATVAAALLHDVGRLLGRDPADDGFVAADRAHDRIGERYLARWFGPEVTGPVGLHVEAKRYLCGTEPDYARLLSPVSVRSLAVQGGPMTPDEAEDFRGRPGWEAGVALRRWDDQAKSEEPAARTVADHLPLLRRLSAS
jgi:gamma-butyrobetaine dioxygenase